jgi:hypothetical protein
MSPRIVSALVLLALVLVPFGIASAQVPIGLNWSEQVNLARDSGGVLLDSHSSAKVIWDKDGSGLSGWNPSNPVPAGDEVVLDFNDVVMSEEFGDGAFAGQLVGNWTADDGDAWTQNGESLYLLAFVPAAYSSSGFDEYGVSALVTISGWPNNVVSHDIVGGGPINTAPVIYVASGPIEGAGEDGSRENPYNTIQEGIFAAPDGAAVVLLPGTYKGAGNAGVTIDHSMTLTSSNGPESTVLDCENTTRGIAVTASATVDGLTIKNGIANGGSYPATCGGGISVEWSDVRITNCVITSCEANASGGGIHVSLGLTGIEVINCLIVQNTAQNGGGLLSDNAVVTIVNSTIADNVVVQIAGGVASYANSGGSSTVTLVDCIVWGNDSINDTGEQVAAWSLATGTMSLDYCCVDQTGNWKYEQNGTVTVTNSTGSDPQFTSGLYHDYCLSQTAAGQGSDSPCLDAGSTTAAARGLDNKSTRTDGVDDAGTVDMGYHNGWPLWLADVYWDQATTSVVLTFATEAGVDYTVESAEGDAYSDGVSWSDLAAPVTAAGSMTTVSDDLSSNPLGSDFRFYRVKRDDGSEYGWQTAAVFELNLNVGFAVKRFFVSTPLEPDPDHAGVQDVLSTQLNYTNVKLDKLTADTGLYARATYSPGGGWANTFSVAAGRSYMLDVGDALPFPHTLRLTGYVPSEPLTVSVTRASFAVTQRWMAYGMPRPTTLGALGLETAITPFWDPTNQVRLLPLGGTIWNSYFWDGANWRLGSIGGSLADSTPIACGEGILFIHNGIPGSPDTLTWPTWYLRPPNTW